MAKKKIYISGPITGRVYEEAVADFAAAEEYLRRFGHTEVVNPITLSPFVGGKTWEEYMEDCMAVLPDCDVIFLIKGWENSRGANDELTKARDLGLEIWKQWKARKA
ncbi:hypothetical protein DRO27_05465 [Candidatus Bathyarchaeota archaeon]|nr:MAG: hypothetical protein DRO27_05465 [Candidatus Bathyarchaeota archaeon]